MVNWKYLYSQTKRFVSDLNTRSAAKRVAPIKHLMATGSSFLFWSPCLSSISSTFKWPAIESEAGSNCARTISTMSETSSCSMADNIYAIDLTAILIKRLALGFASQIGCPALIIIIPRTKDWWRDCHTASCDRDEDFSAVAITPCNYFLLHDAPRWVNFSPRNRGDIALSAERAIEAIRAVGDHQELIWGSAWEYSD